MVLNNSELFPTVWDEAVDLAKKYNVEIPPIGGAVNSLLQAQKLLENFQLSDGKAAGNLGDLTSIDNFLINGQQGYSTSLSNQNSSPGDADDLTGIQQQESRSFISSLDVGPDGLTYCSCQFCTENLEGDLSNINLSDSLENIKQESSPSSPESEIADSLSGKPDASGAGGGNAFTSIPRPVINQQFPPATFNVTYNGLPPQAQAAFDYAVNIWKNLISSPVPITIQVNWAPPISAQNLAQATTNFTTSSSPQAIPNTFYPAALANSFAGSDLDTGNPDFVINFNNSRTDLYFGTNGQTPANQFDFVSVALHEIGHGLGFSGRMEVVNGQGRWGYTAQGVPTGIPRIFDRLTVNGSGQSLINTSLFPNPSTALANQLTSNSVFFNGANATIANGNNNPKLFAPNPWVNNSSYAHFDESTYPAGNRNSLMTPNLNPAEAVHNPGSVTLGLLKDSGWAVNSLNRVKTFRDFNSDGKADIFWRDPVNGNHSLWVMNSNTPTYLPVLSATTNWQAQGAGDFNGDGKKGDIFWRDPATGTNALWLMNNNTPTYVPIISATTNWQVQGIGDFNGDGTTDIFWRDPATGTNSLWRMNNGTPTFVPIVSA
ncbi:MAG: FG-GAP-like repeat-containing protein, partial [Microcoleus sp.]